MTDDDVVQVEWTRVTECGTGKTCPRAGRTGRGTVLVQGYRVGSAESERLGVPAGEILVEVPESLLPEV